MTGERQEGIGKDLFKEKERRGGRSETNEHFVCQTLFPAFDAHRHNPFDTSKGILSSPGSDLEDGTEAERG